MSRLLSDGGGAMRRFFLRFGWGTPIKMNGLSCRLYGLDLTRNVFIGVVTCVAKDAKP